MHMRVHLHAMCTWRGILHARHVAKAPGVKAALVTLSSGNESSSGNFKKSRNKPLHKMCET